MGGVLLQIFLFINVFVVGAVTVIAVQHARAHFKPTKTAKKAPPVDVQLPAEMKAQLLQTAEAHFQSVLNHAADQLQNDLKITTEQLNKKLDGLGAEIVAHEMKRYKEDLEELRHQTKATITSAVGEVSAHQSDIQTQLDERRKQLEATMVEEVENEKKQLIDQMDTKLADAVTSFLIDTLQHNVDLGAQSKYLIATLDEHKAELTKGISDDA